MSNEGLAGDVVDDADGDDGEAALAAELEVLREENRRLREEYARARQSQYRRTALLLVGVGLLAGLAGVPFGDARTVLFALGGTGVFVGVLVYYLTPERFLPASVGRSVHATLARNEAAAVAELGLRDERVYVPRGGTDDVRLFVPQHADYELPDSDALADVFVVTDRERRRGLALRPTGTALLTEFEAAVAGDPAGDANALVPQLTDALVEQFELVESADPDVDAAGGRVTVGITGSVYGPLDRFDHPVGSFLAAGLASGFDVPVTLEVAETDDDRAEYLVTCGWVVEEDGGEKEGERGEEGEEEGEDEGEGGE